MPQTDSPLRERFRFLSAALGQDAEPLHVLRFSGTEGFSRLFSFDLSLATRQTELDEDAILANPACLCILRPDGSSARFTGYPTSLSLVSSYGGWQFWTLRLQPALWKLTQQEESRIYLDCTVEELAREVLDQASSLHMDYEFRLYGTYGKQEFAMQHNESLYGFLAWKLERDGIYFYFDETDEGGRVVFADAKEAHSAIPGGGTLRYSPSSGLEALHLEEVITSFGMTASPLPRRVIERDYDWENPMQPVAASATVSDKGLGDVYCYGDGFTTEEEGQRLAEIRAQALRCRARIFRGESAVPTMRPGFVFTLSDYFDKRRNRGYLVTEVRHEGSQEAWLSQAVGVVIQHAGDQVYYRNSFACIPDDVPFRPERRAVRAKVSGMLTAFIDGSSDSAVAEVNEKGCYKVIFPQDLSSRPNGKSSCWIRRMQPHVGMGHGMTFPLTPGVEVLVAFIDGNPDRPVIAGAVANAVSGASENRATAQSTAIRTAGGSGLVFNDKETKQGLHLGTGGRSGLFMSSGSLDAAVSYTDFGSNLSSSAQTSFSGLAKHSISGFSSKLEASHDSFGVWTSILEIMKDLSAATACFDEGFWQTALGDKDQDKKKSQLFASISSGLASALKVLPATIDALEETDISAVDPFYGAAIAAKEDTARLKLTTPLGKLQMAGYLAFAALSYVAGLGVEGTKAYAAWLSAENEVQEAEKKMLPAYLQEQCAEELRKEHPDWTEKQISDEAKKKAEEMVETDGDALLEKNHDAIDKMLEEGDSADEFAALRRAKWHKMGRSIAQSLAETLIPEAVAFIAVCTKAGKFTSASRLGGLLLCAEDSNAVMGARKETRISSDEKLFLAAGTGHSIYSRYTRGDTLQERLETDFGLAGGDSAVVQRADVLSGLALKKSEHTSLGTISAQAKDAITLTTKYKQADIARALAGCSTELADATTALGLHVKEFGTDAPGLTAALGTAATNMTALAAQFAAPPEYTELSLGRSGAKQQAKLACQGAGCTISLAGTATDSSGVFEAKMANAGSTSTLELKNDSAQVKAAKGADASSLSLASKSAKLASKDSSLDIDGARKQAVLEAGGASRLEIHANSGFHFKSDKNFVANVSKSIKLNASDVSLLKGKVKFSNASIDAKASGSVSLKGGMIKIG